MKIAFITLGFEPLRTSGLDLSGERLVKAMLSAGHQVAVIAGQREPLPEVHNHPALKIYRIGLGKTDWIGFGYRAAHLLNALEPFDIVHFWDVHFGWAYRGRFVASLQHSFRQRLESLGPFSFSRGAIWSFRFLYYSMAQVFAEIPAARRACGLLAGSATTRAEFIQQYGFDPNQITLARHGIDTDFFRPVQNTGEMRRCLGLREGEPVLLFAGFITPRKGLEYLAQALPLISPVPKLLIVGEWRSAAYRQRVLQMLEPVKDLVIETGFVPDEQMPAFLSLADIYVSTSLMEGFGLPPAEALSCETPVVAVDAGALAEVVGPGGILVPPRDLEGFASAISSLLQDTRRRKELGKRGREHVEQEFSIQAMLNSTLEAYERFR